MLRFTSLALLVACTSTAPSRPAAVTPAPQPHQLAITHYQLEPTRIPGPEGRHSASHSTTTLSGSLDLVGERALLRLVDETTTGYVLCPSGDRAHWPAHQACTPRDRVPADAGQPRRGVTELPGSAQWRDGELRIELAREVQPNPARAPFTIRMVLACAPSELGLACSVEDTEQLGMWRAESLQFTRGRQPRGSQAAQAAHSL